MKKMLVKKAVIMTVEENVYEFSELSEEVRAALIKERREANNKDCDPSHM